MTDHAHARAARRSRRLGPAAIAAAAALAASLLVGCSAGSQGKAKAPASPRRSGTPTAEPAVFSPYVDATLQPPYDLVTGSEKTGVKQYTLAFVSPGGGCVPMWGGRRDLAGNPVARQRAALRAKGGDVRISFGGQSGDELARVCGTVDALTNAYRNVIDAYDLTKVDFDLEGPALADTRANDLRARAIVRLQQQYPRLDVSFTLPVLPSGLNRRSIAVLENARRDGARVSTVNIMAMDYGSYYDGDMGEYAVAAATATRKQVQAALRIRSEAEAWKAVAVTPMIGVNDVRTEVFSPADAAELRNFAEEKGLGGLSMWSATRDKPCPHGENSRALATCSSITNTTNEFVRALTGRARP